MNIGGNNMVNIDDYMQRLQLVLQQVFGNRLLYLGLQGSYRRGEETPTSDIDAMVILDYFTIQDMDPYRKTVTNLTPEEQTCGFICGKQEVDPRNQRLLRKFKGFCARIHLTGCEKPYQSECGKPVPWALS